MSAIVDYNVNFKVTELLKAFAEAKGLKIKPQHCTYLQLLINKYNYNLKVKKEVTSLDVTNGQLAVQLGRSRRTIYNYNQHLINLGILKKQIDKHRRYYYLQLHPLFLAIKTKNEYIHNEPTINNIHAFLSANKINVEDFKLHLASKIKTHPLQDINLNNNQLAHFSFKKAVKSYLTTLGCGEVKTAYQVLKSGDINELRIFYSKSIVDYAIANIPGWNGNVSTASRRNAILKVLNDYLKKHTEIADIKGAAKQARKIIDLSVKYITKKIIAGTWTAYQVFPTTYFDINYNKGFYRFGRDFKRYHNELKLKFENKQMKANGYVPRPEPINSGVYRRPTSEGTQPQVLSDLINKFRKT